MQPAELGASEVVVGPGVRFSIGGTLSRTFGVWKRNWPFLLVVAVLAQLPGFLVSLTLPAGGSLVSPGARIASTLDSIFGYVATGLVTVSVLDQLRGGPRNYRRSLSVGASRLSPLIGTAFGTGFLQGLLLLMLVVPGVIALVRWVLVAPIVVLELRAEPRGRSSALTAGHRWEIFGIFVVFLGALVALSLGLGVATEALGPLVGAGDSLAGSLLTDALAALPGPLFLSFQSVLEVVLYEQLRAEKEGVDVTQLAAVFE